MNLNDIILKQYQAGFAEVCDAPVTRRHYIDRVPTETTAISNNARPASLSNSPKAQRFAKVICKFLNDHPGATATEIAKHLKTTTDRLGNYIQRMCDAGVLRYELGEVPKGGGRRKYNYYVAEGV